jgi:hypothetical protein
MLGMVIPLCDRSDEEVEVGKGDVGVVDCFEADLDGVADLDLLRLAVDEARDQSGPFFQLDDCNDEGALAAACRFSEIRTCQLDLLVRETIS